MSVVFSGLGIRVSGSRVKSFMVEVTGFRVSGLRVSGFRVQGFRSLGFWGFRGLRFRSAVIRVAAGKLRLMRWPAQVQRSPRKPHGQETPCMNLKVHGFVDVGL